jgi:hypothetical protein
MGRLQEMEVLVAVAMVRLESTRSVKAQSEVPVVLGVDPLDQW